MTNLELFCVLYKKSFSNREDSVHLKDRLNEVWNSLPEEDKIIAQRQCIEIVNEANSGNA